eukprot:3724283-Rhodomonas_salina.3
MAEVAYKRALDADPVPPYARPMPCPVLSGTSLRLSYAMSGTGMAYGAMSGTNVSYGVLTRHSSLRHCYAICSTDIVYDALLSLAWYWRSV